ncbi:MAG: D-hexose-6-phosphate mutarotase [Hydrogenophaga sp.]|uniref:D-hexose-6-phosphate mutarotase n=1 Tax=Hydrogenophaga sp. TaxID=1904254 RepID=UPI002747BF74|nr:D-hexose-6-phosphate mutarotase [Hydrogenophaga sp.]MDP2418178.1 D-hexose-6-phosphate mutarotase [Hydrogenophaga sp.]MDZ4186853.1 D-hexose-6-phosphate mutarotase [Hydrogenophaga sp.]
MNAFATHLLDGLNATHGQPGQLWFDAGPGGLPFIHVHNAHAQACISLYGGQVLSFRPHAHTDLLFLSEQAVYQLGKAIRGGVPLCWPWFGPDPQALGRPNHGFARTRLWSLLATGHTPNGETHITLGLTDEPDTRTLWPHAFELTLNITLGATLELVLTTRNTGTAPFDITQALHSYFAVSDSAQATVTGLDGCTYIDNATGAHGVLRQQAGGVRFEGEVDRIYTGAPAELALQDRAGQRTLSIASTGSQTAVVWNPGAAVAARMADLPSGGERHFVCVETANAANEVVTVAPGGEHRLMASIGLAMP